MFKISTSSKKQKAELCRSGKRTFKEFFFKTRWVAIFLSFLHASMSWPRIKNLIQFYGALLQRDTNYINSCWKQLITSCLSALYFKNSAHIIPRSWKILLMPFHVMKHKVFCSIFLSTRFETKASWNFMVCDEKLYEPFVLLPLWFERISMLNVKHMNSMRLTRASFIPQSNIFL